MTAELDLVQQLRRFGAPADGIVRLAGPLGPAHIPYLDLCPTKRHKKPLADAVVELERRPVIYVVRGFPRADALESLCRVLAQRGQAEHLAVLEPGQLHVFPLDPFGRSPLETRRTVLARESDAPLMIPQLALGANAGALYAPGDFHKDLLALLTSTIEAIVEVTGLDNQAALSWVGRALFFRFLIDRGIIEDRYLPQISAAPQLADCFAAPAWADQTSAWMDAVFNGDLLPLPRRQARLEARQREGLCRELSKILQRTESSGQLRFDWDLLDFGHIPIGLLSQVYENYSHRFEQGKAIRESIRYTPRAIAEYVVAEALHGLANAHHARILDPAAGAGIFLVAGFRALVGERWKQTGQRPDRKAIREILNTQIVGFDINEAAIRLAALSLYLTALELDPEPRPLAALRFDDLRGKVLFDMRADADKDNPAVPALGSLGAHVPSRHRGAYDLVVGNPPWTTWKIEQGHESEASTRALRSRIDEVEAVVSDIVHARLPAAKPFAMIDKVPDLPFLWRGLDWLRPRGRLAMIVHARLLFKQSRPGVEARDMLFGAMRMTGVLNGSALRQTAVWPDVDAQFCICFAENALPGRDDVFSYVSPYLEETINQRGVLRVDASDAKVISHLDIRTTPTLLKTLYRGTELDAAIIERLSTCGYPTLDQYWTELKLRSGQGFLSGANSAAWKSVDHLLDLPELTREVSGEFGYGIDIDALPAFRARGVSRPRQRELYQGPLVLVPESPPTPGGSAGNSVHLALGDVAFNRSFFGFSCHGHPQAGALARYLLVLLASELAVYLALMRSSRFGVERDTLLLADVRALWIRPFDTLTKAEAKSVSTFAHRMLHERVALAEINDFVYRLYRLTARERETIRDSLRTAAPFSQCKRDAQRVPTREEIGDFVAVLKSSLAPFFRRRGRDVTVCVPARAGDIPWIFLRVFADTDDGVDHEDGKLSRRALTAVVEEANRHGASLLSIREPRERSLLLGLLGQLRFWTPTRARLLAGEIRRVHEDYLLAGGK